MDTLRRATGLLRPFMDEERRGTWLTLAFHAEHRAVYDSIPRTGSTRDFTVNCVRQLLDRGCLGQRHALSLLLDVVREEAGEELQEAFRSLIDDLDRPCVTPHPTSESPAATTSVSRAPERPPTTRNETMPSTSTILFLAASPDDEQRLALDEEAREIRTKIRGSDHRDSLIFRTEWAVRPDDLLQYLNEYRPQAVHFSGHGTAGEIILKDDSGHAKPVSREALRALFGIYASDVRAVILNACYSRSQAEAIVEVIDCAVGMSQEIGDEAAIVFAAAFYRKLGFGASVREAFDEGRVALMLQGIPEEKTPELLVKKGVDARQLFLVGPEANPA